MWWIVLVFGVLALGLILFHILAWKQLKSLSRQLRMMHEQPFENMILRLDEGGGKFSSVVIEMNAILETLRSSNRKLLRQKQVFKTQISSISHDLRTPLTSILGYLELAKEEQDPEKRNEYLEIISKRSEILQTLIVDFYDLSRLEDEEYQLHCEFLSIDAILEDTLLTFYQDFIKSGFELKINIEAGTKGWVARQELVRVYTNLIQNILRHGVSNAEISHYAHEGKIYTLFSNGLSTLKKFDTERLFERFYTGDVSRNGPSTGLGLYTVRLLLEKMGHKISAEKTAERLTLVIEYGN